MKEAVERLRCSLAPFAFKRLIRKQGVISAQVPPKWMGIFIHTCIETGAVSVFLMLSFAGVADDEGDASRLRLSEGLCLELFIIRTRKDTFQDMSMKIVDHSEQCLFRLRPVKNETPAYGV